jgi:hypothetical protein
MQCGDCFDHGLHVRILRVGVLCQELIDSIRKIIVDELEEALPALGIVVPSESPRPRLLGEHKLHGTSEINNPIVPAAVLGLLANPHHLQLRVKHGLLPTPRRFHSECDFPPELMATQQGETVRTVHNVKSSNHPITPSCAFLFRSRNARYQSHPGFRNSWHALSSKKPRRLEEPPRPETVISSRPMTRAIQRSALAPAADAEDAEYEQAGGGRGRGRDCGDTALDGFLG